MANDLNLNIFSGHLGQAPEIRYTTNGTAVANVSLAVGGRKKNGDQWEDKTTWVRLVVLGKRAETMAEHLDKGAFIRVTCEYQNRKWQAEDGSDRYAHEFLVQDFQFLDKKGGGGSAREDAQAESAGEQHAPAAGGGFEDSIPF